MEKDMRMQTFLKFEGLAKAQNKTALEVAKESGVFPQLIYYWRSGRSVPTAENLGKLSKTLGTTIEELIS